ncbi:hypothetical protein lerEdw1_010227 [Lerista edwardsae]|nr:hypothetical protein lerEdw1_010227 [Lerista edwardsae]
MTDPNTRYRHFHWQNVCSTSGSFQNKIAPLGPGKFSVIPPKKPVIGFLGKDVILPCMLTTSSVLEGASIIVQWVVTNPSEKIYVYHGGKKEETQNKLYQGRMELFDTELSKGNMSLKLKNSQLSDQRKYICMITLENWYDEVTVELKLAANGAEPTIALELYQDWGIGLTCSSQGWYPTPPVLWLNSEGENRTEKAESTNTEQEPGGTFHVSSSMTVQPGGDNGVSCKIINNVLRMASESRILISDVFYPTTDLWLPPFIITLLIDLGLLAFVTYKLTQNYQTVSRAAAFTVDPAYKHPELSISEDQKRIRFKPSAPQKTVTPSGTLMVVGKEGYNAGKHYWELGVGDRLDWEIGVLTQAARDKVKEEKFSGPLGEGCWALRSSREGFFTHQDGGKIVKKDVSHQKIGIFLDQEHGTIKFYNAEIMFLISSIPIQSNEKLHPFLSFVHTAEEADQSPLDIIHVRILIPLKVPV